MKRIRLLLVDDHTLFRQTLHSYLDTVENLEVVGEAQDGMDAITKSEELKPDIVLMDFAMPNLNGIHATREIRNRNPETKILVLTMYETGPHIREILRAGASGYIHKGSPTQELISAIQAVSKGEVFLCPSAAKQVINGYVGKVEYTKDDSYEELTERERELLSLIAEGKTNKNIAGLLKISVNTVQTHRLNLMKKLDIHDSSQLVRYAIRKGLIVP